jgi:hypothetical protein
MINFSMFGRDQQCEEHQFSFHLFGQSTGFVGRLGTLQDVEIIIRRVTSGVTFRTDS